MCSSDLANGDRIQIREHIIKNQNNPIKVETLEHHVLQYTQISETFASMFCGCKQDSQVF